MKAIFSVAIISDSELQNVLYKNRSQNPTKLKDWILIKLSEKFISHISLFSIDNHVVPGSIPGRKTSVSWLTLNSRFHPFYIFIRWKAKTNHHRFIVSRDLRVRTCLRVEHLSSDRYIDKLIGDR